MTAFDWPTRTKTRMPRVKVKTAKKVKKKAQYTGGVTKGSKGVVPENLSCCDLFNFCF